MADKAFFSSRRKAQRRCPNPQAVDAAGSSTPVTVTAPTSPDDADGSMTFDVGAGSTLVRATGVRFAPFRVDGRFVDAMFVMSAAGPEPGV